jgi:alcohol dehydrogenase class IV
MSGQQGGGEIRKFVVPELVLGEGVCQLVGQQTWNLGVRRALLVTDPGVAAAGWTEVAARSLRDAHVEVVIFSDVKPNPSERPVMEGAELYRQHRCDGLVAVGGGSPMDVAKGIGVVATNGGHVLAYEGVDRIEAPIPPIVCVPTTAGSSADVSQFAIITDSTRRVKIAIISKTVVPDASLIDPVVLTTMPPEVTAGTGLDALTHAVEAYVSSASSPLTDLLALEAVALVPGALPRCLDDPGDLAARAVMARASLVAGMAFSNAILGATHALAHALGGLLDAPHGECNAILLEHVVRFNLEFARERYARIGAALGAAGDDPHAVPGKIAELRRRCGIPGSLRAMGIRAADIPLLARHALADACLATNPRPASQRDLEVILEEAL